MITDRMAAVLARLHLGQDQNLAAACADALEVDGVSLSLTVAGPGAELIWSFGKDSVLVEELQFTLGEGPAADTVRTGAPITVPDVRTAPPGRWPALRASMAELELSVGGLFCFPLRLGAIHLGVLTAVSATPGPLRETQTADALALASALTAWYLGGAGAEPNGATGTGLRGGPGTGVPAELHRAEVHQATGMVSVQLEVSLAEALLRLRAYAYSHARPLHEVAGDVVARRLRLPTDTDTPSSSENREG
ncbi:GAF and ANTAR domain-containing protein [Actinacidiphila sp. ITFR-21]|uniref:GAF and ANTAR domain-containing protein n=1 Tax=Actinacidiphila sp. ITFR-21 TaxID=3075199 RepID=UPI002889591C|nr:GAF and ANTAR domain-containing protein [Streptomyces sp. ITFR-21]WNI16422.1 GAF and ANTAR domain-containing protein [Streptomyces sp. ITFR-21]